MARKAPKPRPRRKANPRRPGAARARARGRGRKPAPKARRAAAARAPKAARSSARRRAGGKKATARGKKAAARRKTAARKKTAAKKPARTRAPRTAPKRARKTAAARPAPQPRPPRTAAPARRAKVPIGLLRERRTLREEPPRDDRAEEENRYSGAARTGKDELLEKLLEHTETGPVMTGGDIDGDWEHAYSSGDEAPGGDNPTPDQARVDDNGKALGIHYDDNEELRLGEKEAERDRHRWELDPASAEDYRDRDED